MIAPVGTPAAVDAPAAETASPAAESFESVLTHATAKPHRKTAVKGSVHAKAPSRPAAPAGAPKAAATDEADSPRDDLAAALAFAAARHAHLALTKDPTKARAGQVEVAVVKDALAKAAEPGPATATPDRPALAKAPISEAFFDPAVNAPTPVDPVRAALPVEDVPTSGAVLAKAANLLVETAGGDLRLHLRVVDKVADVRVDGASPAMAAHLPELRVALAQEGLSLGRFDTPQGEDRRQRAEEAGEDRDLVRARVRTARPAEPVVDSHGVHVKA